MLNCERILLALDQHLEHHVELVLYGRAAIALGFDAVPEAVKYSFDVDVIIPSSRVDLFRSDDAFWNAQEAVNKDLEEDGLYLTHLFEANDVFLRKDWEKYKVNITRLETRWLKLFRPATLDLILTKMMRGDDAQDMEDIQFLIHQDRITTEEIESAFEQAVIPDLQELRDAFELAKPRVRELAKQAANEK